VKSCTRVVGASPALPNVANEVTELVVKSREEDILQIALRLDRVEALEQIDVAGEQ